jgi:bifunctional DNA-binding transcriptional regulator/antitoxin component of YhaV-PrlF toxin-antitoxin module
MVEITVQADGTIEIPAAVSKRLGIGPGTRLALDEGKDDGAIHLHVLPAEAQLVEVDGVWVIRSPYSHPDDKSVDWIARTREERATSIMGEP